MNKIQFLEQLFDDLKPISIFLYGSRARMDFLENSDYEIWVLMKDSAYMNRAELSKKYNWYHVKLYPFKESEFSKHNIDTPFPKGVYFYELWTSAITLFWDKIVENLKWVELTLMDLLLRVRFDIWVAMMSVLSLRNKDKKTAFDWITKSCLYWLKSLEILQLWIFPKWYDAIYQESSKLKLWKYKSLVDYVYSSRKTGVLPDEKYFYKNISFLNNYVETELLNYYEEHGNVVLKTKKEKVV